MRRTSFVVIALCTGSLVGAGAAPAFAGEIRGPGSPTGVLDQDAVHTPALDHAQSICAASGLNHLHDGEAPTRVQSWGQIPKADRDFLTSIGLAPAQSCNGHTGWIATGGPPA